MAAAKMTQSQLIKELASAGIPVGISIAPMIPALNDHELENILKQAMDAGASNAWYTVLRLPHEVSPLFRDWLDTYAPGRAKHVMSLVQQMRGGKDYDSDFKNRMHGQGEFAKLLHQRFRIAAKRLGLERHKESWPALDCSQFTAPVLTKNRPAKKPSGQGELF